MRYDSIIIGTGPAGLEAAINLKIRKKSFLLFGQKSLSNKLITAPKIDNYLGLYGISGKDLAQKYTEHLSSMDIEISEKHVSMVYHMGDYFSIATPTDTFEATTIILATGTTSGAVFKGETEYLGRGVGYCATCDAPLYRGKKVAIIGYTDDSIHEANFVASIAEKVYYIPYSKTAATLDDRIKVVTDKVVEIVGDAKVTSLRLQNETIELDGVFVLRETIAPASLVPGLLTEDGFIKVDAKMQTNLKGLYAAGDCAGKPHQYMKAAGQGQTAALEAVNYIDKNSK